MQSGTTWVDEEPGLRDVLREIARLGRRAASRPFKVLAIAALITAAVVGQRARKAIYYSTKVVLRVVENDRTGDTAPRPKAKLREYVNDVVFTTKNLIALMEKHDLYPSERRLDMALAVEAFRDDIDVNVFRNYFLEERWGPDSPLRSARIAVRYRAQDPQRSLDVARALADLVVRHEMEQRRQQVEVAARSAAEMVATARKELIERRAELAAALAAPETAETKVQVQKLLGLAKAAEKRVADVERAKSVLDLTLAAEKRQLQLQFDQVDPGTLQPIIRKGPQLVAIGLAVFFFGLPLVGAGVGALDTRVYDEDDVRRLGLQPLGRVPRYAGDDAGSLKERRHADPPVSEEASV